MSSVRRSSALASVHYLWPSVGRSAKRGLAPLRSPGAGVPAAGPQPGVMNAIGA